MHPYETFNGSKHTRSPWGTVYLQLTTRGAYLAINIFISIIIWNLAFTKQRYIIVTFTDQTFFA